MLILRDVQLKLLVIYSERLVVQFPKTTRDIEPISYRGALLSTLLDATVYMYTCFYTIF
jgi:hypothetical protein